MSPVPSSFPYLNSWTHYRHPNLASVSQGGTEHRAYVVFGLGSEECVRRDPAEFSCSLVFAASSVAYSFVAVAYSFAVAAYSFAAAVNSFVLVGSFVPGVNSFVLAGS